uniref:Beta-1,4-galactosyltransferase 7 n=1 Tax=Romanomermis culicivorax TaxID=13658 RepID=A0A915KKB9_ROMCU
MQIRLVDFDDVANENLKRSIHKLCVLVPFRDRFDELLIFAPYMHQFLLDQAIDHEILIVNQVDNYRFNRASLINVGFLESCPRNFGCDYFAMHDVDLLPLNSNFSYEYPRKTGVYHLSSPDYHPLYNYSKFIGGILLMTNENFRLADGMSNKYWGWGLEDDEFYLRLKDAGLIIERPPKNSNVDRRTAFRNLHNSKRYMRDMRRLGDQKRESRKRDRKGGLRTVKYTIKSRLKLAIDMSTVHVLNIELICNRSETPWC